MCGLVHFGGLARSGSEVKRGTVEVTRVLKCERRDVFNGVCVGCSWHWFGLVEKEKQS